jgi:hypothetical protein
VLTRINACLKTEVVVERLVVSGFVLSSEGVMGKTSMLPYGIYNLAETQMLK